MPPALDQRDCLDQRVEDIAVQELVPQRAVQALVVPLSQGLPSSMNSVRTPTCSSHFLTAFAVNSDPLSLRMWSGLPCSSMGSARQSSTSSELRFRPTRIAAPRPHDRRLAGLALLGLERDAVIDLVGLELCAPMPLVPRLPSASLPPRGSPTRFRETARTEAWWRAGCVGRVLSYSDAARAPGPTEACPCGLTPSWPGRGGHFLGWERPTQLPEAPSP